MEGIRQMTGTDVAVRDRQSVALTNEQLKYIAHTEFVPPGLRGNLPAILACVATGRELGIGDMVALKQIHIIDGKATFSAELMVQLVRRRGHSITGEVDDGSATVTGKRADNGDEMTSTWTLAMAERAGLLNKGNWKKYPEAMLWARAASQLCRMLFADCFAGATYTPEELDGDVVQEPVRASVDDYWATVDAQDSGSEPQAEPGADDNADLPVSAAPAISTGEQPSDPEVPMPTPAMLKKLNVLVGQLRDQQGLISTPQLWRSTHREPVASEDGEFHWAPLRDQLSKQEASELIERLQKYADEKAAAA